MLLMKYFSVFLVAFFLTVILIKYYIVIAKKLCFVSQVNQRSSHKISTPVGAGIVVSVIWCLFVILQAIYFGVVQDNMLIFLPAICLVFICGYWDDLFELSAKVRVAVILSSILIILYQFPGINTLDMGFFTLHFGVVLGWVLFVLGMLWFTVLFNFMDGSDGIAGMQAIFVFMFGGGFLWLAGSQVLAITAWFIVPITLAFLVWNWPPARVFMGDVGSMFYGLLISIFAISSEQWAHVPLLLWVMLCMPFCADASLTVIRRLYYAEPVTEAHCSHAFQRLLRAGWSHQKLLCSFIGVLIITSLITCWTFYHQQYLLFGFLLDIVFCLLLYLGIESKYPMFRQYYVKLS